jgi:hypothetical protein
MKTKKKIFPKLFFVKKYFPIFFCKNNFGNIFFVKKIFFSNIFFTAELTHFLGTQNSKKYFCTKNILEKMFLEKNYFLSPKSD